MRTIIALLFSLVMTPALANNTICDSIGDDADINASMHMDPDFDWHGDTLTITAKDGTEYSVTRDGDLFIDEVQQDVSADTRADIAHYVDRYAALETSAEHIAQKATGLAISALTHALVALVTQGEDAVDAAVEEKTGKMTAAIENDAQDLCRIVIELRDTEREIRAAVPKFGPFIEFEVTEETGADSETAG